MTQLFPILDGDTVSGLSNRIRCLAFVAVLDDLDQEILSVLGHDRLITPDDVRGKIIILMITATG